MWVPAATVWYFARMRTVLLWVLNANACYHNSFQIICSVPQMANPHPLDLQSLVINCSTCRAGRGSRVSDSFVLIPLTGIDLTFSTYSTICWGLCQLLLSRPVISLAIALGLGWTVVFFTSSGIPLAPFLLLKTC